jgi:ABC-2 type transport system permease protein
VMIFYIATGIEPRLSWLLLPLIVAALVVLCTGLALLLSALYVRFRDLAQIWGLVTLVVFYCSPIIYVIELYPHGLKFALSINPLAPLLEAARNVMLPSAGQPSITEAAGGPIGIIGPVLVTILICVLGFRTFVRAAPRIAEEL